MNSAHVYCAYHRFLSLWVQRLVYLTENIQRRSSAASEEDITIKCHIMRNLN